MSQAQMRFDPYKILGVPRNASLSEIKKRYYKLVKKYHPDRNNGDDKKITIVTKAYNILSDPSMRAEFDSNYTAGHTDLRDAYKNYESYQVKHSDVSVKGSFSKGDLESFNKQFEERRQKDPNDRGYGDDMVERIRKEDVDVSGGSRRDRIDAPKNLFGNGQFDPKLFNRMFEHMNESTQLQTGTGLIERGEEDPAGFSLLGGSSYSEIAVYNGAIIDREVNDFSKLDARDSLNYTDYKQGYSASSNRNLDNVNMNDLRSKSDMFEEKPLTEAEMKRLYSEKMSEYATPLINIPEDQRKRRWKEDEWRLEENRDRLLRQEQDMNKEIVFKYKDQYPTHMLQDLNLRNTMSAPSILNEQQNRQPMQNRVDIERPIDMQRPMMFNNNNPHNTPNFNADPHDNNDQRVGRTYDDLMKERMIF